VDFNSLSWHTLSLVAGGNALGKAVSSSGLLNHIAVAITAGIRLPERSNCQALSCMFVALPLNAQWMSMVLVFVFCGTVSVFVSHTVAAIILMPIVYQVGTVLQIPEVVVIGKYTSLVESDVSG
jgi:phosphate transporter